MCAIVAGKILNLAILESNTEIDTGKRGKSPGLPATVCCYFAPGFSAFGFGKMPRARAMQRVRF